MDKIAAGPASDRRDLFQESASRLGMNPAIVEKDFWVCWILKLLFAEPALKDQMVFKGGTSLSKVFGLIDRFSEDIDLVLDWRLLGYHQEGAQGTQSKTQQSRHNQEMNAKAVAYIRDTLLSQLNHLFAPIPGIIARIDEDDPHTVNVFYPAAFEAAYIRPAVRLEIGPLASWVPSSAHSIKAYAAQAFPEAFSNPVFEVIAIDAERTFWEKATILHQEAHRPGAIPARYSRHYYDLYKLSESPIRSAALSDLTLLKSVVEFKERFYYSSWARYELAIPGSFRLSPPESQLPALERDYRAMRDMFYREPPTFEAILAGLASLEQEINAEKRAR
ncbi:MAG TPA: nucleotidyl transferase AbiEii/AbiGii toxin family protein [Edaphobacter sp.]|nr:nucleotidyl transferase AbiEii/AbiGii toxin family protein [Edaphobacter sp.]